MTREDCIEAMAREMHDGPLGVDVLYNEVSPATGGLDSTIWCREMGTAAYDAMADHIRAREEAVRERCAVIAETGFGASLLAAARIRALDIGGENG